MDTNAWLGLGVLTILFFGVLFVKVTEYERTRNNNCSDYCYEFTGDKSSFLTTNYCCCDNDSPLRNGSFDSKYCVPIEILMRD